MVAAVLFIAAAASSLFASKLIPRDTPICPAVPQCPQDNGCVWTDSNGLHWTVACSTDFAVGDLQVAQADSFEDCIFACSVTPGCVAVSQKGSRCYLKSQKNAAVSDSAVNAAWVSGTANAATPTSNAYFPCTSPIICPTQDGCSWNSPNGRYMTIRCNRDFYGGDSISQTVAGYYECVGLCLNSDAPCQAVSFAQFEGGSGAGRCYLKNMLNNAVYDQHIHGAYINHNLVGAPVISAPVRPTPMMRTITSSSQSIKTSSPTSPSMDISTSLSSDISTSTSTVTITLTSTTSDDSSPTTTPAPDQSIDIAPHNQTTDGLGDNVLQSMSTDDGPHDGFQTDAPTNLSTDSSTATPISR